MKAVVSVLGKDKKGIIAKVATALYEEDVNILDISQTIIQNKFFTMIMAVEMPDDKNIDVLSQKMSELARSLDVDVTVRHEDIFNSMHRV